MPADGACQSRSPFHKITFKILSVLTSLGHFTLIGFIDRRNCGSRIWTYDLNRSYITHLFLIETNRYLNPLKKVTRLHLVLIVIIHYKSQPIFWKWPEGDLNPPLRPWKGRVLTSRLSGLNLLCFIFTSNQSWPIEMETRFYLSGCLHRWHSIYLVGLYTPCQFNLGQREIFYVSIKREYQATARKFRFTSATILANWRKAPEGFAPSSLIL